MVQYGVKDPYNKPPSAGYGTDPTKAEPSVKQEDPSPPAPVVDAFHKNAARDTRPEDIHHTVGPGPTQAASGQHRHDGSDSPLLLEGVILTGSKGGNLALPSIISALVKLGAKDSTT